MQTGRLDADQVTQLPLQLVDLTGQFPAPVEQGTGDARDRAVKPVQSGGDGVHRAVAAQPAWRDRQVRVEFV